MTENQESSILKLDKSKKRKKRVKPSEEPALPISKPKKMYDPNKDLFKKKNKNTTQSTKSTIIRVRPTTWNMFKALRTINVVQSDEMLKTLIDDALAKLPEGQLEAYNKIVEKLNKNL